MSDQHMNESHQPGGNGGFEREDLGAKSVFGFLIILAVVGVLVFFAATGVYRVLDSYSRAHQPAETPLKQPELDTRDLQKAKVEEEVTNTFPQPLLETDERTELNDFLTQEADQLNSYGWIDQKAGVVHIPIERAMQLMAQRGLPVAPQGAAKQAVAKRSEAKKP